MPNLPGPKDEIGSSKETGGRVETLARGLTLLLAFTEPRNELTLKELAEITSLPKSTALRMLSTLEDFGFVTRYDGLYRVGHQCLLLGNIYGFDADLHRRALPIMQNLMDVTGEVVQLGVIQNSYVLYLERVQPQRSVTVAPILTRPGSMRPAHCTALGKSMLSYQDVEELERYIKSSELEPCTGNSITDRSALLADLETVRDRGYAVDNTECDPEVCCVGAPILDSGDKAIAALSVSAPGFRLTPTVQKRVGPLVRDAANRVSSELIEGGSSGAIGAMRRSLAGRKG